MIGQTRIFEQMLNQHRLARDKLAGVQGQRRDAARRDGRLGKGTGGGPRLKTLPLGIKG
jgi:hypothetical protein